MYFLTLNHLRNFRILIINSYNKLCPTNPSPPKILITMSLTLLPSSLCLFFFSSLVFPDLKNNAIIIFSLNLWIMSRNYMVDSQWMLTDFHSSWTHIIGLIAQHDRSFQFVVLNWRWCIRYFTSMNHVFFLFGIFKWFSILRTTWKYIYSAWWNCGRPQG